MEAWPSAAPSSLMAHSSRSACVAWKRSCTCMPSRSHRSHDPARSLDGIFMLPDPDHQPSLHLQQLVGLCVSLHRAPQLLRPEARVGDGLCMVLWAPVPVATI